MVVVLRIKMLLAIATTCVSEPEKGHKNAMTDLRNTCEALKQCNIAAEEPSMSMLQHDSKFLKHAAAVKSRVELVKSRCPQRPQFYSTWLKALDQASWGSTQHRAEWMVDSVDGKGAYVRNSKAAHTSIANFLLDNFPNTFVTTYGDLDDEILKSRKLFTFVRDPLLMARSGFEEMIAKVYEKNGSQPQATIAELSDDMPFLKIDPYKHPQEAFETYLQDIIRLQQEGNADVLASLPGANNALPQIIRLHLVGLEGFGFLGAVEDINNDIERMQDWLGIPDDERVDWKNQVVNEASKGFENGNELSLRALVSTVNFTEAVNRSVAEMLREDFYCLGYQDSIKL